MGQPDRRDRDVGRDSRRHPAVSARCGPSADEEALVLPCLSARERRVAALVANGLTNKQVAGRLFGSEKTFEKHLARAFEKLGVSSRAAVARLVEREQRVS